MRIAAQLAEAFSGVKLPAKLPSSLTGLFLPRLEHFEPTSQPEIFETLPEGPFKLILADPPWHFKTYDGESALPTVAVDPYRTLTLDELKLLPVASIAEKDALLVMWVVGANLEQALELGRAWGFEYVTDLFWWLKTKLKDADQMNLFTGDVEEPRISMGYHSRKQGEMALLFKRGRGLPVLSHSVRQVITEPPREHSRKPDCVYERLEQLYGQPLRIELFSRGSPAGWAAWGDQADDGMKSFGPAVSGASTGS